jgi:hypothetical protein
LDRRLIIMAAKREIAKKYATEYSRLPMAEKAKVIDTCTAMCEWMRKRTIKALLMADATQPTRSPALDPAPRRKKYGDEMCPSLELKPARDENKLRGAASTKAGMLLRNLIKVRRGSDEHERMMAVYAGGAENADGQPLHGYSREWIRMAAANTAAAGCFFADRTIGEYNRKVWQLSGVDA